MNQRGFVNILIITFIVILAGVVGYFALVKKSPSENQPKNNLASQQTPPTAINSSLQQTSITYPAGKTFTPNGAKFIREFRLDFENDGIDEIVVVYSTNTTNGVQNDTGFIILAHQSNNEWKVVYDQLPARGVGIQISVDSIKAPDRTQGLFVLESEAGAGTSADWYIITKQMKKLDRKPVLDQVLNTRGYVFMGYNEVKVMNDVVVETVPGYSKNAARCCPDKPALEISYRFTGTAIEFVSVKELAKLQL
jgi:hypothetical protein